MIITPEDIARLGILAPSEVEAQRQRIADIVALFSDEKAAQRPGYRLGPAVVKGELQYTSISQLEKSDPNTDGGCLRRWFIRYVLREREDSSDQMFAGDEIHEQFHRYITTGEDVLGRVASAARIFIPRRGPDLRSEMEIYTPDDPDATVLLCAGVPLTGKIDLVHTRGEYLTPMGTVERDLEGTVEIIDWKSKGTLRDRKTDTPYYKTGPELVRTIQMPAYAERMFRELPTLEHARLSHVYMQRKGAAEAIKSTTIVPRERIAERWEHIEGLGRRIVHAARETDPNKIDPNPHACKAYNRQCGYTGKQCHLDEQQTLASIFGPRGAESLMSQPFPPFAPGAAPDPTVSLSMTNLMASLGGGAKPAAPAPEPITPTPEFLNALATIRAAKLSDGSSAGRPPFKDEAALLYTRTLELEGVNGRPAVGTSALAGDGRLGGIDPVTTAAEVVALATSLCQNGFSTPTTYAVATSPAPVAAPAPAPPPANPLAGVMGILPPDAPASQPHLAAAPPPAAPAAEPGVAAGAATEAEKKKRGRPPAAAKTPTAPTDPIPFAPPVAQAAVTTAASNAHASAVAGALGGIVLGIDSRPSVPHQDLDPYVHALHQLLVQHMHLPEGSFGDIRCSKDERLSHGQWRGTLAAFAREKPPAPGVYFIDTRDEISAVVAEALRPLTSLCFRGVR